MLSRRRADLAAAMLTLLLAPAGAQPIGIFSAPGPLAAPILQITGSALPEELRSDTGWTIATRIDLTPLSDDAAQLPETLLFVPIVDSCSFARIARADFARIVSSPDLAASPPLLDAGYQGRSAVVGARLPAGRYRALTVQFGLRAFAWNTRVNEPRALAVPWPDAPWSRELALCLEPQLFVESDAPEVLALVERWTNGRPTRAAPYHLAKHLAAQVLLHMPTVSTRNLENDGFAVSGALAAARSGRGTGLDLACLLCAVYRAAGIPARIVVCADAAGGLRADDVLARAVVEFFLPPEASSGRPEQGAPVTMRDGRWIPVDIQAQRESSSRPPPFDQPWAHFGNGDRTETLVPLAFHFHAPVESARVGAPALWSWTPGPASNNWRQRFTLNLNEAAIQPGPTDRRFRAR